MFTRHIVRPLLLLLGLSFAVVGLAGKAIEKDFDELDQNRDGYIDKSEATRSALIRQRWNEVDKDGDGRLSAKEFKAIKKVPDEPYPD